MVGGLALLFFGYKYKKGWMLPISAIAIPAGQVLAFVAFFVYGPGRG